MDKILSARLDEAVVERIGFLAKKLNTTKKAVIENAVNAYSKEIDLIDKIDLLDHTLGAWERKEASDAIRKKVKKEFKKSMERHK